MLDSDLTPIDERHSQVEQGHDLATLSVLRHIDAFSQAVQKISFCAQNFFVEQYGKKDQLRNARRFAKILCFTFQPTSP